MNMQLLREWIDNATLQADIMHREATEMLEEEKLTGEIHPNFALRLDKAVVAIHEAKGRLIMARKALE